MRWRNFFRADDRDSAAEFRRVHESWLTRALASRRVYPEIPLRREDQGGFDALRASPTGRAHADLWWSIALARVDG
ncbi:MAG: hypothetical protein JNM80_03025 [Phycisphaerae bacterium]|nr:hypothetical protein [Phycisphaerae bacterium]